MEEIPEETEEGEEETKVRRKNAKTRVTYGAKKTVFPELFQNGPGRLWTIRIDSRRLEKVESEDPDATRDEAAKELAKSSTPWANPGNRVRMCAALCPWPC